ncbi:hypothetical protein RUR49_02595 [Pseudoxanthobacter sp. M-2]|uniref:hypothetical protein n=1 Tax=Pseudoxanthobacter sp. M-2 TaxID=3078754 RepID=UPI0038FBEC75
MLHLMLLCGGTLAAAIAWDLALTPSIAHARGGEGEGGGGDGDGGDDGGDDGGNSGRGGDDGGKSGRGSDDGPGDDSGGRGRGRGRGSDDDDHVEKGKSRTVVDRFLDTLKGRGRVVWASTRGDTIEVRYADGWGERVGKDGYALFDPRRNIIVERPAKPTDFQRLRAAAAGR